MLQYQTLRGSLSTVQLLWADTEKSPNVMKQKGPAGLGHPSTPWRAFDLHPSPLDPTPHRTIH